MAVFLINKLMYKYNAVSFLNNTSLEIGSLISLNLSKVKFRSNFFGIVIKRKKNLLGWSITLRNVLKKYAIEKSFNLSSNNILNIFLVKNKLIKFANRHNLFYLRSRSKLHSTYANLI